MSRYEIENWGDMQDQIYAKGIITAVDSETDTADVTVEGYQDGSEVPIFYHCSDDAEERDNGAIEGGSQAFSVDDEVIVMCEAETGSPIRIIGFVDGIRECGFRFKIIRDHDFHVLTDSPDDWDGMDEISFWIASNKGNAWVSTTDETNPVTYDPDTERWSIPIPEAIRDEDGGGYVIVCMEPTKSVDVQFLMPDQVTTPPTTYPYIWHFRENENGLPYQGQTDEESGKYLNTMQPGSYDVYVPYWEKVDVISEDYAFQGRRCAYGCEVESPEGTAMGGYRNKNYSHTMDVVSTLPYKVDLHASYSISSLYRGEVLQSSGCLSQCDGWLVVTPYTGSIWLNDGRVYWDDWGQLRFSRGLTTQIGGGSYTYYWGDLPVGDIVDIYDEEHEPGSYTETFSADFVGPSIFEFDIPCSMPPSGDPSIHTFSGTYDFWDFSYNMDADINYD